MKLTIRLSHGGEAEVTGRRVGDFLVHRPARAFNIEWHVTHIATLAKFPCAFDTQDDAIKFARAVKSVMDWSAVKVEPIEPGSEKTRWAASRPTPDQRAAVKKLMERYAGIPA